jgi:colicin import membrane protein
MTQTPYHVPKEPGGWRAVLLATLVHAGLFGLLWFGVNWQSETPIAIEAEVWSPQVREAAPRPQPITAPEPKPAPEPPPRPEPKPVVQETPKPVPAEPPVAKPDIALEQEKKRKEERERLQRAEAERQRAEKARLEKERLEKERLEKARLEKERLEKERLEKERLEKQRIEQERLAKERAEKEKAEALARKEREERLKREAAEKKRLQELEEQRLAKLREETLQRMMAQAGTGGAGSAEQSQGARGNADYLARVGAKIRSNTIFSVPDSLVGNPAVEYAVDLLPDGSIRGPVRKLKSSGVPGFDEAVLNAIEKSQPFPPDKSGKVPSGFNVIHRPKDQ